MKSWRARSPFISQWQNLIKDNFIKPGFSSMSPCKSKNMLRVENDIVYRSDKYIAIYYMYQS